MLHSVLQNLKRNSSDYLYFTNSTYCKLTNPLIFIGLTLFGLLGLVANCVFEEKSPLKTIMGLSNLHILNIKECLFSSSSKPTETSWVALPPFSKSH